MTLLPRLIADFPFVLALLASMMAGLSAVLLRRAAPAVGTWAAQAGAALWAIALAFSAWSFLWAFSLRIGPGSPGVVTSFGTHGLTGPGDMNPKLPLPQLLSGLATLAAGAALLGWSVRARAQTGLLISTLPSLVERLPYRRMRRPGMAGVILVALGVAVLSESLPVWVWFALWLLSVLLMAEMADWELRTRYPGLADYFRRTPRFLPHRRSR